MNLTLVCVLLLAIYLYRTYYIRVGGEESGGMCYERRRAEACVD